MLSLGFDWNASISMLQAPRNENQLKTLITNWKSEYTLPNKESVIYGMFSNF